MLSNETVNKIIKFRDDRNWGQFHTLKNLCSGLSVEVAELQEIFLWQDEQEVSETVVNKQEEITDEIADIMIFLTYITKSLNIDMDKAVLKKIKKNEKKYPINKAKNKHKKYSEL